MRRMAERDGPIWALEFPTRMPEQQWDVLSQRGARLGLHLRPSCSFGYPAAERLKQVA
jgi:hypothetical protein